MDYLRVEEIQSFKDVDYIMAEIVGGWGNRRIGEKYVWRRKDKAKFYIPCKFSECYGDNKGFELKDFILNNVKERNQTASFTISCGGYGDQGNKYHCDDWLEIKISVVYID